MPGEPWFMKTNRLGFRAWTEGDFELAWALWGDARVTRLIGGPFNATQVRERVQRGRYDRGVAIETGPAEGPLEIPLLDLLRALQGVLQRAADAPTVELDRETLSVGEKMVAILDRLALESPLPFTGLFAGMESRIGRAHV